MSRHKTISLFALDLLLLVAAPAFASSHMTAGLRSGETVVLEREDRGALALTSSDDPAIQLVEVEGAGVVVRLTPMDRSGLELGSGRVIVVGPTEKRSVRLRNEFERESLYVTELRIEVLQGAGRVMVVSDELRAQTNAVGSRRRAIVPAGPTPTSITLLDNAEAAGTISSETALLYRVFALFADARLPAQYRGDDSGIKDSLYLAEVRDRFATLSPATQATLQPFLTPPAYKDSWANVTASSRTLDGPPPCAFFSDSWGWVDTSNNLVRVWYRLDVPNDALSAGALAKTIDATIWPKLSGLMTGHLPIADLNESCNGGNGKLDIYLVDAPRSLTLPYAGCSHVPVFILLARTEGNALAAHEIFHAFEFSFPLGACIFNEKYHWWAEASAQWAQDFVFPSDDQEHASAPSLLGVPEQPLDLYNDPHWYGAYLLPFYVKGKSGSADFVRASWEGSASQPALEAIDAALPGGFDAIWPAFVRDNWNRAPIEDYKHWDGLTAAARADSLAVDLSGLQDASLDLKVDLPRLSATYNHYTFNDTTRSVAFWNGVSFNLDTRDVPGGVQYDPKDAAPEQKKGAHVQALMKLHGQTDWQIADWTNQPYVTLCRDELAERIDELVIIISNSEFKERDRKLKPAAMSPLLWVSNMGCWQWKGTTTYSDPFGANVSATATWTRAEESQSPPFVLYKAAGTLNWNFAGACSGSGTLPIMPELSFLFTYNYTPSQSSFRRVSNAIGAGTTPVSVSCPPNPAPVQAGVPAWINFPPLPLFDGIPGARFVKVSADGKTMDDSYTQIGGAVWQWHFEAQRQ